MNKIVTIEINITIILNFFIKIIFLFKNRKIKIERKNKIAGARSPDNITAENVRIK